MEQLMLQRLLVAMPAACTQVRNYTSRWTMCNQSILSEDAVYGVVVAGLVLLERAVP